MSSDVHKEVDMPMDEGDQVYDYYCFGWVCIWQQFVFVPHRIKGMADSDHDS